MTIPMAYGNEVKAEALRKARNLNRKLMLLRQQEFAQQQAKARQYNDGYRY